MEYTFEFKLTEEQVKEMESALHLQQDKYYAREIECMDMGNTMLEERRAALGKFMVVDEIIQQFNGQLLKYKLL